MKEFNRPMGMIDVGIQAFIFSIIIMSWVIGIVERSGFIYAMIFQFFFGAYQMGSAFVGMIKGRKWKIQYFFIAMAYIIVAGFAYVDTESFRWKSDFYFFSGIAIGIIIPMMMGAFYMVRTYIEMEMTHEPKKTVVSF